MCDECGYWPCMCEYYRILDLEAENEELRQRIAELSKYGQDKHEHLG